MFHAFCSFLANTTAANATLAKGWHAVIDICQLGGKFWRMRQGGKLWLTGVNVRGRGRGAIVSP
jgi:uncharacterized membrane protein